MVDDLIHIDGSQGEGGGQIVRSSLALSMVTGRPVTIERVRAGRSKPGLMNQHLAAVHAAQKICHGDAAGAALGSSAFTFRPGEVVAGNYHFAIGTAGSTTLVLQTVLPPLMIANHRSRLVLEGGTHNPWAPPFDFLQRAFLPLLNRMGPRVTATLERPGFYPAGGGRIVVEIEPAPRSAPTSQNSQSLRELGLSSFHLLERGDICSRVARVLLGNLPDQIAERELKELARLENWEADCLTYEPITTNGPGNAVVIEVSSEHLTEVFVGLGERGVKAESVVQQAVTEMHEYLVAGVPVGPHLADQLMLPMALCAWQTGVADERRQGSFRTMKLTDHSKTQIEIIQTFLGISMTVEESDDGTVVNVR